jgi:hypothetical protein
LRVPLSHVGFARRSQSAGGSGPFEGPEDGDRLRA